MERGLDSAMLPSATNLDGEAKSAPPSSHALLGRQDGVAILVLIVVAVVVLLPALRADVLANGDTPVHLAEIADLARAGRDGWSELGFCGFPLGLLQPPLIFGGTALLARWGAPLEIIFQLAIVASLIVPALVFYWVARKRLNAGLALGLAVTLPLYRASISGEASTLSGMFAFYFAAAALWALADFFVRPERTLRDVGVVGALAGFIGLSHMYVTIALVYLAGVHVAWSWSEPLKRRRLIYDLPGLALGALAAAAYWLPNLLAHTSANRYPESIGRIATRLLTSSGHGYGVPLSLVQRFTFDPIFQLDTALQLGVLVLVALAVRPALRSRDDLPKYGFSLALALLVGMVLARVTLLPLIGPTGTRLVYVAKMGLLATCFPLLDAVAKKVPARRLLTITAVCAVGFSFLLQRVVAQEKLPSDNPAMQDVRNTWAWIKAHHDSSWGRLYIQDTFGAPIHNPLDSSHVLVRTAELTGAEQVGAYYGLTPYDQTWLTLDTFTPGAITRARAALDRANITHLLVANAGELDLAAEHLTELVRFGRFAVLARDGAPSKWSSVLEGSGTVSTERISPGRMRITRTGTVNALSVSESYHRFWRAENAGAVISADAFGMLQVHGLNGAESVDLVYAPPRAPWLITFLACAIIAGLFGVHALRATRRPVAVANR